MPATETWMDQIGRVAAGITGIKKVYSGGKSASAGTAGVVYSLPDVLPETPAAVLFYGGGTVIPGMHERNTRDVELAIYVRRVKSGDAYALLLPFDERVIATFAPRAAAYQSVESCLVVGMGGIEDREWGPDSYLVLPFRLEVKFNVSRQYTAA